VNQRHGQFSAVVSKRDSTIVSVVVELSFEHGLVPPFGVSDVRQAEIILLGPKEWHGLEPLSSPKHVASGGLSLTLGDYPMLHPDALAREPIRPTGNVTRREDPRYAGLEVFVYADTAIDGEACVCGQGNRGADADADDDQIGCETFSRLQRDGSLLNRGNRGAEMKCHAVPLVEAGGPSLVSRRDCALRDDVRAHRVLARQWAGQCRQMNFPMSTPRILSIGTASGATTCTAIFRARSDAVTSRPMKLAPITTACCETVALETRATLSASVRR
jgi:hypothetical protein